MGMDRPDDYSINELLYWISRDLGRIADALEQRHESDETIKDRKER